jgi:hypothetical protein
MTNKIEEDYFDLDDSDESIDYFEKIYHKRHNNKRRNEARRKLERLQESQALERMMQDDIYYDWE